MNIGRYDIENAARAIRRRAARVLDDETDRVGFIDEAQAAGAVALAQIAGVEEDASASQDTIGFGDQRGDPAHVLVLPDRAFTALDAIVDEGAYGRRPMPVVRGIDRIFLRLRRNIGVLLRAHKSADPAVEDENLCRALRREDDRGLRPVDHEARGQLIAALLQEMRFRVAALGQQRQDREDRADGDIGIDVGGAVDRVHGDGKRRLGIEHQRFVQLLRKHDRDRRAPQGADEKLVADDVELLLHVAAAVDLADRRGGVAGEGAERDHIGHLDCGAGDLMDERGNRREGGIARGKPPQDISQMIAVRDFEHVHPACSFLTGALWPEVSPDGAKEN